MDSSTIRNFKPEIISPAGNPEKLKFAVLYGADSVYFGGDEFNLRIRAGNFSEQSIIESIEFCHSHGVKAVFLLNAFLHENDLSTAKEYIQKIKNLPVDSIMVSDPAMIMMLQDAGIEADLNLSTQMNTLNHLAMKFWQKAGVKRIVLGRETTLDEIKMIKDHTDIEIEVFAHGALCVAYSGRCLLSRFMSGRDANQGDCSQPCRWRYSLVEEKRHGNHLDIIEYARGTEILSSKDLCLIERIEEYIDAGVNAFKIEGRMKSLYHAANTTRVYKHAVSLAGTEAFHKYIPFWLEELDLINHRPYTDDLFNEFDNLGFCDMPYVQKAMFTAYKDEDADEENTAFLKIFNPIKKGELLDGIFPITGAIRDDTFTVVDILDDEGNSIDMARPNQRLKIKFDKKIDDWAIFRRRLDKEKK